jgi:hypothetical protein
MSIIMSDNKYSVKYDQSSFSARPAEIPVSDSDKAYLGNRTSAQL